MLNMRRRKITEYGPPVAPTVTSLTLLIGDGCAGTLRLQKHRSWPGCLAAWRLHTQHHHPAPSPRPAVSATLGRRRRWQACSWPRLAWR